jgi:hypothetical protein
MKKTAIVLILILIAGMAFAQELKFDGYVNSGLGVVVTDRTVQDGTDTKKADPYIAAYGVDSEQTLFRFRLNGSYTNADGNAGAKFRFQAQTNIAGQDPILPYAFGWVKFFNIFTVNAGIVNDSTWESRGAILTDDQGEGLGVLVKVSPMEGLDLGAGAYTSNSGSGSQNNALINTTNASSIDWKEAKYTVNGSYTLPSLLRVNATYRGENRASGAVAATSGNSSRAIGELQLLAVENLTAIVEGELDNLQDFDPSGKVNIYETVGYKLNDLQFGLNAAQYLSKVDDSDMALRFNPWVSYTIGKLVPRLDVVYFMGGQVASSTATAEGKIDRKGYAAYEPVTGSGGNNGGGKYYDSDASVIGVRPSLKINLDSKTTLEIGDLVNFEKRPTKFFGAGSDLKDSKFTNTFYVDLTVKF